MKRILRYLLILIVIVVFAGTLVYLYRKSRPEPEVFTTEKAFYTDIIRKTVATGSVIPRKEIEIKPQVSGIIDKIFVEPGDIVASGDLIARVRIIPNMVNLNNAESRVEQARIRVKETRLDFERKEQLHGKNVIPLSEFQTAELTYSTAKAELDAAENNLQLIREGVTKRSGQVSNTLIRSTIRGMILDVPVEEGNSVIESNTFNAGTTIASVADMGEMIFEGNVDESEVGRLKPGMELILVIGAIEGETFRAVLEYIAPKGVEQNGAIQFQIKAAMELREGFFVRAGYSANADIVLDRRDSVLAIREALLRFENNGDPYVEVSIGEQTYEKRPVLTGISDGINIEILEGLSEADSVKIWNIR